ncbi:MAG: hypothetical protein KC996_04790 [Phycisphaerales bacterium]|nr:hypothetical protein [Phycisphaerales bacterium]
MPTSNESRIVIDQLRLGGLEATILLVAAYRDERHGLWISEHALEIHREADHTVLQPHQFRLGDLPIIEKLAAWAYEQMLSYEEDSP